MRGACLDPSKTRVRVRSSQPLTRPPRPNYPSTHADAPRCRRCPVTAAETKSLRRPNRESGGEGTGRRKREPRRKKKVWGSISLHVHVRDPWVAPRKTKISASDSLRATPPGVEREVRQAGPASTLASYMLADRPSGYSVNPSGATCVINATFRLFPVVPRAFQSRAPKRRERRRR